MNDPTGDKRVDLSRADYQRLLAFRVRLRQHNAWQEQRVAKYGLTFQQFQLLLCVKGHGGPQLPTVTDLAEYMVLKLNSTIELVNRCEAAGFIAKVRDHMDARVVRVATTPEGDGVLAAVVPAVLPRLSALCKILTDVADSGEHQQLGEGS